MQNFENAHYDFLDAQLDGLDPSLNQTETIAEEANDNLGQFPDELADRARADLQEARTDTLLNVNAQRESTKESVGEAKGENLDRELVLSINERFSDVSLKQRQLFEASIIIESQTNLNYQNKLKELFEIPSFAFDIGKSPDDYIKRLGIPTSTSSLAHFNKEFKLQDTTETREDTTETREDTTETREDTTEKLTSYKHKSDNLRNSLNFDNNSEISNTISTKLDKIDQILIEDLTGAEKESRIREITQEVNEYLGSGQGSKLWELLASVPSGSQEYKNLTDSLVSFDASFDAKIKEFESPINNDWLRPSNGIEDRNDGSLDIRTYVSADGSKTEIDTSVFPPKREVSLSGSEYRLETETPMTKDIQEISTKYELAKNELSPKINSLSKLIKVMETIGNSTVLKLDDVKNTLINKVLTYSFRAQNPEVVSAIEGADSLMSLQNLATSGLIATLKKQYEDELEAAEKEYKQDLADQVDRYRDMMNEKDRETKKVLKLLKDTGFDFIAQGDSNKILAEIVSGQLIPELGVPFDIKNIDLVNGDFGEPKTLEGSNDQFVRNVVRFMNKLIGLKPDGTDSEGNLVGLSEDAYLVGNVPHTPEEIQTMIHDANIISGAGGFNMDKARENLSRPLSELENTDTESLIEEENSNEFIS